RKKGGRGPGMRSAPCSRRRRVLVNSGYSFCLSKTTALARLFKPFPKKKKAISSGGGLELHHLEIFFPRAALGTAPAGRDVLPTRAGDDPVVGPAFGLVVDVSAGEATPGLVLLGRGRARGHRRNR